jgi:hypothetical protein
VLYSSEQQATMSQIKERNVRNRSLPKPERLSVIVLPSLSSSLVSLGLIFIGIIIAVRTVYYLPHSITAGTVG